MSNQKPSLSPKEFVAALKKHGSLKAIARATGHAYAGIHSSYTEAVKEQLCEPLKQGRVSKDRLKKAAAGELEVEKGAPIIEGSLRAKRAEPLPRAAKGVTRFLFTAAQNNTRLFTPFWNNLLAYAAEYGARLHVSQFAYVKNGLGAQGDKAQWIDNQDYKRVKDWWWDERIVDYRSNDYVEVAPGLIWCGDQNILPTAERPLSGFEVLTGRSSGIFPHVKFAMESIATVSAQEPTKFNYTTGTVTQRNYIQRKAGMKAEFHHCYGALLVEVNEDGDWWCRQVNANSEGDFYEIDPNGDGAILVRRGEITTGHRIEALNAGDAHAEEADAEVFDATWGEGGLVDTLRPKFQFYNDLVSFTPRSHHTVKDPHKQFLHHVQGTEDVYSNMQRVIAYLEKTQREWCQGIVVFSNHDAHVGRWLKEQDGRRDPVNARFWFALNSACYNHMQTLSEQPNHFQLGLRLIDPKLEDRLKLQFLSPSEPSFVICRKYGGGIECGLHGDKGPNGARGSANNIAKMGRKANIGHSHSARIVDGVYQAGTSSRLQLDYNDGPSSWSQTHVLTYPNGKRTMCTVWGGRWRA